MICNSILDAIGNTPVIRLQHMTGPDDAEILAKFEGLNVGGSIKTRTALNMINDAEKKGLKQGIVSSKRQKQYGIDMGRHGYDKRMDAAVLFEDTPHHKPDPEPMLECLRRLGVEAKDALYLGDARSDMVAARAAGMDFAYASWGSFFPMERDEPDFYLDNPRDLIPFL